MRNYMSWQLIWFQLFQSVDRSVYPTDDSCCRQHLNINVKCDRNNLKNWRGSPRPKYIFNKCGTNFYFFTLQRNGPSPSPNFSVKIFFILKLRTQIFINQCPNKEDIAAFLSLVSVQSILLLKAAQKIINSNRI